MLSGMAQYFCKEFDPDDGIDAEKERIKSLIKKAQRDWEKVPAAGRQLCLFSLKAIATA